MHAHLRTPGPRTDRGTGQVRGLPSRDTGTAGRPGPQHPSGSPTVIPVAGRGAEPLRDPARPVVP